jgi:hypothetical protein
MKALCDELGDNSAVPEARRKLAVAARAATVELAADLEASN